MDLFMTVLNAKDARTPLAERMRPKTLQEYEGQHGVIAEGKYLRKLIEQDELPSLVLWGPPGVGKTTLAHIIATMTKAKFLPFSAVNGTVAEVRTLVKDAEDRRKFYGERTILFVDEIHRFNKAQQDAFLPPVEKGIITLIGATTENPSFEINSALLSRCRVVVLERLSDDALGKILDRALKDNVNGLGKAGLRIAKEARALIVRIADGDARTALNLLDIAASLTRNSKTTTISADAIREAAQKSHLHYDKNGEEHYNIISALHKSMRGSDADAALYWLGRMLEAGEDPLYIARRLVRFASEDIGLADPNALTQAVAAFQSAHMIGMPECNVILAQCVAYMAQAPKSNKLYTAYKQVQQDITDLPNLPVPLHIRNAPTKLMKDVGYGKGYKYTPNYTPEEAAQDYLPDELKDRKYL